jgi:phosphoserine phosphatase
MSTSQNSEQFTGLILLSGVDKPGITQALFDCLAPFSISILDIGQVVIKDRLILTVLFALNPAHQEAIESDLSTCALDLDVDLATLFSTTTVDSIASKAGLVHVVVLARKLSPAAIAALSGAISGVGANIERVSRIASNPITAIEFLISGANKQELNALLAPIASAHDVDIAVSPGGVLRHARKLVQLDVDSTLISQEVIDLLAMKAGVADKVIAITESAMRGEIDFAESLQARVALLKGLPATALVEVQKEITLTPGAQNLIATLQSLGHTVSVVSGGFIDVIEPLLIDLKITLYKANKLEVVDGLLTGKTLGPIIDRAAKAQALHEFASSEGVSMEQTIAIGDGANDLDMIAAAGLGIAFNAKPAVRAAADASVNNPYLDSVLYLLGIADESRGETI